MKVCLVAQECYPYQTGGMSDWIHQLIRSLPEIEFIVLVILPERKPGRTFAYQLPKNLTEIYEVYLKDDQWERGGRKKRKANLGRREYEALRGMLLGRGADWETIFGMFRKKRMSLNDFLMGEDFLKIATEVYKIKYFQNPFSDFLWTLRGIYYPLFLLLKSELPKADVYHAVSGGYAGVLGSLAKHLYHIPFILSEHGNEMEECREEMFHVNWPEDVFKNIRMQQMKEMAGLAYGRADRVVSLYEQARERQLEAGCSKEKTIVIPKGIRVDRFVHLPEKNEEDEGAVNVGSLAELGREKDIKTLIYAYKKAKEQVKNLKLWIMGSDEADREYAKECALLVRELGIEDVVFTGRVSARSYLGRMDFTVLTSIRENQPQCMLQSFAAHKPVIASDVGNCRELLYGAGDSYGASGILTHVMNVSETADAMIQLAQNKEMRMQMGENGYRRVRDFYTMQKMSEGYEKLYCENLVQAGGME